MNEDTNKLESTGERLLPWTRMSQDHYLHLHRYLFAGQFTKNKSVLDLGSGEGYGCKILSNNAKNVIGVDIEEKVVRHALNKYKKDNLDFKVGSILKIPIDGKEIFDVITCFEVIEHIVEHEQLLNEVKRLLKKDGLFIASTPNKLTYSKMEINPFHKKELTFIEFLSIQKNHFEHVKIVDQGIFAISNIQSREEHENNINTFLIERQKDDFTTIQKNTADAEFFISVCSNKILPKDLEKSTILLDIKNEFLKNSKDSEYRLEETIFEYEKDRKNLRKSVTELKNIVNHDKDTITDLRSVYNSLFEKIKLKQIENSELTEHNVELTEHNIMLTEQKTRLTEQKTRLTEHNIMLHNELSYIQNSFIFKNIMNFTSKIDSIFPDNTSRGEFKRLVVLSLNIISKEGLKTFLIHATRKILKKETHVNNNLAEKQNTDSENSPYSLPFYSMEQCEMWMELNQPPSHELKKMKSNIVLFNYKPLITICIPVYNPKPRYLLSALNSVINQIYDNWEIIIIDDGSNDKEVIKILKEISKKNNQIKLILKDKNDGIPKTLNLGFSKAKGEFLVILDNDDILEPNALYEIVKYLNEKGSDFNLIYSDEALINEEGQTKYLHFRPDFSIDFFLSHQYFIHLVAVKTSVLKRLNGCDETFPNVSWDYDLWGRVIATDVSKIGHIPKILYRWREYETSTSSKDKDKVMNQSKIALQKIIKKLGIKGKIEDGSSFNYFRVKRDLVNEKVSIIIPTRSIDIVKKCLKSIEENTGNINYEIVIIVNNLKDKKDKLYFEELSKKYKILFYDKKFNYSAINNYAVKHCDGKHLLFLNDDTEIILKGSIESMLEHSQRNDVGAVGAKLLYPDDTIQHAGVIIGLYDACEHIFKFQKGYDLSYMGSNNAIRNYSAVTGAALMMPRKLFEKIGGFDEKLSIIFNDVDICLRLRKEGYLVVYTPYALFYHYEHASRKDIKMSLHPVKEDLFFKERWKELIKNDPYFSPNFSRYHLDCRPNFGKVD